MKLLNFTKDNETRIGVKTDKGILDLREVSTILNETIPSSMEALVREEVVSKIADMIERVETRNVNYLSEEEIDFSPSMMKPEKIVCVGLNYLDHIEEVKNEEVPKSPVLFSKFNNALAAHNETIPFPKYGVNVDYEAELVLVIGKQAKDVSEEDALDYVFGYSAGNDLSVRDLQFRQSQWLLGKTTDKFAPVGPYIVTADEIDPSNLEISCKLNGEIVQQSTTEHMIYDCATIVSYVSQHMTLQPGDLIFTGTPQGVIHGQPKEEQVWLKAGDEIEVTIENIGTLKNKFV